MHIRIGLETNIEGRYLAWALDYPGCFAFGEDEPGALIRLTRALIKYELWVKDHTQDSWVDFKDIGVHVVERFENFWMSETYQQVPEGQGYEINAWFVDDWRPLTHEEVDHGLKIFHWQREELLAGLTTLDSDILTKEFPGQDRNILEIAKHIATAELWYLQRLDLTDMTHQQLPEEPEARLAQTAALIDEIFPNFPNEVHVVGKHSEFWSYRKILRRTLYHQRDHIEHIKELAFSNS